MGKLLNIYKLDNVTKILLTLLIGVIFYFAVFSILKPFFITELTPMMKMMMGGNMGYGMMGNYGFGYWNFINILYTILLIGLIILVYFWIIKLWRDFYDKKK